MWNRADIAARWADWNERMDRIRGVIRPFRKRIAMFFAIVGPGLIVSNVDNDAGGIYTYAQSSAQFGNTVLWTLIPMTLVLYISLEMCARLGAYSGKGLSDLIREEFGFRVTFFLMAVVLVVNLGNVMAEFTGVFWATDVLGINKYVSVPLSAVLVWVLVVHGSAKWVERIFLTICMVYLSYVISALLAVPKTDWLIALLHLLPPHLVRFVPTIRPFVQVPPFNADYAVILAGL